LDPGLTLDFSIKLEVFFTKKSLNLRLISRNIEKKINFIIFQPLLYLALLIFFVCINRENVAFQAAFMVVAYFTVSLVADFSPQTWTMSI
jgi:hypothetical protein